jgi:hypothetical protein
MPAPEPRAKPKHVALGALGLVILLGLGLILLKRDQWGPANGPWNPSGGIVIFQQQGETSGEGLKSVEILTDGTRVNRVNARRRLDLIESKPHLFGTNAPFRPLLVTEVSGPLNVRISGVEDGPLGKPMEFHVPEGTFIVEAYPEYASEKLWTGEPGQTEKIVIETQGERGKTRVASEFETSWSGPEELFLSSKNLGDLASIIRTRTATTESSEGDTRPWLEAFGQKIKEARWRYETDPPLQEGDAQGWQRIRTEQEMGEQGTANCLDISVLLAHRALESGRNPFILANSGHALCAVSDQDKGAEEALAFEGTDFLIPPLKPKGPDNPEGPREYLPNEEIPFPERKPPRGPERRPEEKILIDVREWMNYYRTAPK